MRILVAVTLSYVFQGLVLGDVLLPNAPTLTHAPRGMHDSSARTAERDVRDQRSDTPDFGSVQVTVGTPSRPQLNIGGDSAKANRGTTEARPIVPRLAHLVTP